MAASGSVVLNQHGFQLEVDLMTVSRLRPNVLVFAAAFALTLGCQNVARPAKENPADTRSPAHAIAPALQSTIERLSTRSVTAETLAATRASRPIPALPSGVTAQAINGLNGAPEVTVLIYDPQPDESNKPAYLHMHGGGFVLGSAAQSAASFAARAESCNCVIVSVDYRLAPEATFPGPVEDNLAALSWLHNNAAELGIDKNRIAIGGESAGGGHAAMLAIAARDRGLPVVFQVLIYPMLDDRTGSVRSVPAHIGHYVWNSESNQFGWSALLGQAAGLAEVPYGSVPARLEDLTGLPPAWIGVGGADLFLSEDVEYARRLTEAGTAVELLVIPGGYHAFDFFAPESQPAIQFRASWTGALRRALHPE